MHEAGNTSAKSISILILVMSVVGDVANIGVRISPLEHRRRRKHV